MVQESNDDASVPEKCLGMEIVDADWIPEFNILDCLEEWKVGAEKANKNITSRPILHVCKFAP